MRDPNRIDKFCNELKTIWHQVPDWRLSQLMKNILNEWVDKYGTDPFYAEDTEFMNFMNDYIKDIMNNDDRWIGDKIRIIHMEGEPQYTSKEGTVEYIDDAGGIHGSWGGCALIPGKDVWELIDNN